MMKTSCLIFTVTTASFLAGCGGSEQTAKPDEREHTILTTGYSGPRITDENRDLTLSEIAGIWHFDIGIEGIGGEIIAQDELYIVITEDGRYMQYDYKGDEWAAHQNQSENCYLPPDTYSIAKTSEGGFAISTELDPRITLTNYTNYELRDGLLIAARSPFITDCKCKTQIVSVPRSSISLEELNSMLCDTQE